MTALVTRPLAPADRDAWEPLWRGYLAFYKTELPQVQYDLTWARFHDPAAPMFAVGCWRGEALAGIAHYLYHPSCWTAGPYCYLQDLFTTQEQRGQGVGRALIEAVYAAARDSGASRVYWTTHETNAQAMLLYDTLADRPGFVQYRKIL